MGISQVMNFILEKLKEALHAMENLGSRALAWFDQVFPPDTRGQKIQQWIHVALPFVVAAVALTVVVCCCRCCCRLCCGRRGPVRMMKAPGRNRTMRRSDFESDPRGYFHQLRANPGDELC